jgi:hypothetical protein
MAVAVTGSLLERTGASVKLICDCVSVPTVHIAPERRAGTVKGSVCHKRVMGQTSIGLALPSDVHNTAEQLA